MRLICPRCSAEYEIEDRLIPAGGREVQCSSCDNVWFQLGRLRMEAPKVATPPVQTDEAPAETPVEPAPEAVPPLAPRGLPEDVMDILRDEAAHFRANRPGLTGEEPQAAADAQPAANDDSPPVPAVEAARDEAPEPAPAMTRQAEEEKMEPVTEPAPAPTPEPAWHRTEFAEPEEERSGGFALGFLIGLIIAAGFYAVYRFAPDAGEGVLGDTLRSIRAAGLTAHEWVQAQIAAFR